MTLTIMNRFYYFQLFIIIVGIYFILFLLKAVPSYI